MIEKWREWIAQFDAAVAADDFESLRSFLHDDVTYTVSGAPFACHLSGADAVLAGFRKSIHGFDRAFDERAWYGVGVRSFDPDTICARAMGVYRMGDKPLLHFSAPSVWQFHEGTIIRMHDCYDTAEHDVQRAFEWLAQYAPDLDASYV